MKKSSSALYGYGYSLLLRKVAQNDKLFQLYRNYLESF